MQIEEQTSPVEQPEIEIYPYGDLILKCACGHKTTINKTVEQGKGVQIILVPQSNSVMRLVCEKCDAKLELSWVQSSEEDIELLKKEEAENESVPEASEEVEDNAGIS